MPEPHTPSDLTLSVSALRVFRTAAALRSFSAVGLALGYSQSAVSRKIAALEAAVGAAVFERTPRGVQLTEAGEVLLGHATVALDELDAARASIVRLRERVEGRLAVGTIPVLGMALVPRALARFSVDHPRVSVELHEGSTPSLVERVAAGTLDVAVVAQRPAGIEQDFGALHPELVFVDTWKVAVAATHRLAGRGRVGVDDVRHEPWIVGRAGSDGDPVFGAWPTLQAPTVVHTARDWPARLGLVAAGLGVAVMPGVGAPSVPVGVALVDVDDPRLEADPAAVAVSAAGAPRAAAAFVDALRIEAAGIAVRPAD